jgi:hypothetical protein
MRIVVDLNRWQVNIKGVGVGPFADGIVITQGSIKKTARLRDGRSSLRTGEGAASGIETRT